MKQFSSNVHTFYIWLLLSTFPFALASQEQSIELSSMGSFAAEFTPLEAAHEIQGNPVIGYVTAKTGSTYQVNFPFEVQQIMFAVNNGERVEKGDKIGEISGFDVHHFLDELEAAKTVFLASQKHYLASKASADARTFKSTQWLEITKNYSEAKLNYEHFSHLEKVISVDSNERFWVLSPADGIVYLEQTTNNVQPNKSLFEVIPVNSLWIKTHLPEQNIGQLLSLAVNGSACELSIKAIEPIVNNYRQTVWASPTPPACNVMLGQQLRLNATYSIAGVIVPKHALFEWENQDYVAVKKENKLVLVNVDIIGKQDNKLIVTGDGLNSSSHVLSSSVSIAQGLFMGLGE